MEFTQAGRSLYVQTPLGEDVLMLTAFRGYEQFSGLFEFHLETVSTEAWIDPKQIVGKAVNFSVTRDGSAPRWFSGFVARFGAGGLNADGFHRYSLQLVPWAWFLGKRSDCRVFQSLTVVEIVQQVFEDAKFSDFDISGIQKTYPKKEYCVQLRETDLQFVSRLLEEVGIFWYFRFLEGRHEMVLADGVVTYEDIGTIEFTTSTPSSEQINHWEHRFEFISGAWTHTDFNFTTPLTSLQASAPTVVDLPGLAGFERFEYPGGYEDKAEGDAKAQARMMAEEADHDVVIGQGGCPAFQVASRFTFLGSQATGEDDAEYVLTRVEHSASEESLQQSGGRSGGPVYQNLFRCIPASVTFVPPRLTPKPLVNGLQSAIVVGPSGEEVYTDKYGRVKVQFHWDRTGKFDDGSSCWIRVMQAVAGKRWGMQTLPRVGQEVILEFLDGDPDRPVVVGALYNENTLPTYELPANKTQSGWKSRSVGGGTDAFNEIRFEDKSGQEHIYIRAQKDEHHTVVNDRHDQVGNDEHRHVARDRTEAVDRDHHLYIGGDELVEIGGNQGEAVGGDRNASVGGAEHVNVGSSRLVTVGSDQGVSVGANHMLAAGADVHVDAGKDIHEKAGMNFAAEGGMNVHLKGGMNVVIEAGMTITLKAGAAKVVIGPANVDVVGVMVNLNSGGGGGSGSGCKPKKPAKAKKPEKPQEPKEPLAPVAMVNAKAYKQGAKAKPAPGEARWLAIESAPSTPQAAALEAAAVNGDAFCES